MNLREFAAAIHETGGSVVLNANKMKIGMAMQINQGVVLGTPVDTGRARANWQVGLGVVSPGEVDSVDKGGSQTANSNDASIQGAQPGQTIHLYNNVAYIARLNDGWSAQAPAGYIEAAVAQSIADAAKWKMV